MIRFRKEIHQLIDSFLGNNFQPKMIGDEGQVSYHRLL